MTSSTPEEIGKEIYRKSKSAFAMREDVIRWLDEAKRDLALRVDWGFYHAEMGDQIGTAATKFPGTTITRKAPKRRKKA